MIKTAITGADSPQAGELIRLLLNHPDVELMQLVAPRHEGQPVQAVHHGLIGEERLSFSSILLPNDVDVVFITESIGDPSEYVNLRLGHPELKIVLYSPVENLEEEVSSPVFALPEINRKALVRGATTAILPAPLASLALVPLYPLALHMLLPDNLTIEVTAPADVIAPGNLTRAQKEIEDALRLAQRSFAGTVTIKAMESADPRAMSMTIEYPCAVDMQHLLDIYEIYDDHHFAFTTLSPVTAADAVGTEKSISTIAKTTEGNIRIETVADCRMRGASGEAVHVLNLLFGLQEQTGLALKASSYCSPSVASPAYTAG